MKRISLLKVVNPILAILLLNQVLSALFREMLPRDLFEVLHEGGGVLLALAVLVHVVLNWNWVRATFFRPRPAAQP